jgi:hypothetical protein
MFSFSDETGSFDVHVAVPAICSGLMMLALVVAVAVVISRRRKMKQVGLST